jgi:hypothetical protein
MRTFWCKQNMNVILMIITSIIDRDVKIQNSPMFQNNAKTCLFIIKILYLLIPENGC